MAKGDRHDDDALFHALANEHRRVIVHALARQPMTVGDLTESIGTSMATISKHLTVLERAHLVQRQTRGRHRVCTLRPEALQQAQHWMQDVHAMWASNLDRLADHLADPTQQEHTHGLS